MDARRYLLFIVGVLVFCPGAKGNDSAERAFYVQPRVEVGVGYYELQFGAINQTIPAPSMGTDSLNNVGKLEFNGVLPTMRNFYFRRLLAEFGANRPR